MSVHKPTDEKRAQVSALAAFGVNQERIAKFLGMKEETLKKHYSEELETGADKKNAEIAGFLFHTASGRALKDGAAYADCVRAAMFWAKTRMRWREKDEETQDSGVNDVLRDLIAKLPG